MDVAERMHVEPFILHSLEAELILQITRKHVQCSDTIYNSTEGYCWSYKLLYATSQATTRLLNDMLESRNSASQARALQEMT